MTTRRIGSEVLCREVAWHFCGAWVTSPIRTVAFPPRRGVVLIADVIDDLCMPPAKMTRICRELGISAALSWLASHSSTLHEVSP